MSKKTEEVKIGSPSEDRTNRYPTDALLRKHGYTIYSRFKNKEPQWIRAGKITSQSRALVCIEDEEVDNE